MRRVHSAAVAGCVLRMSALLCLALITSGCQKTVTVEGVAMSPTIKNKQVVNVAMALDDLQRGDIVAFRYPLEPSKSFVQRVVGLPGDAVIIARGIVTLNGKPLAEPYVFEANRSYDSIGPIVVPPEQYFVLGDNRRNSSDSRHWGLVPRSSIWGKVTPPSSTRQ